jgi:hypothetical protein
MTTYFPPSRATGLSVVPADLKEEAKARPRPSLRRYEVSSLRPNGDIDWSEHKAPALPTFEAPFTAMARGTILTGRDGQIAIEDLMPGDWLETTSGEAAQVVWIGSTAVSPSSTHPIPMARVMADSFGISRPMNSVLLGPSARILKTAPHMRHLSHGAPVMTPIRDFIDGMQVIDITPSGPVQTYNICLSRHAAIYAGGLEIETYHPGAQVSRSMSMYMRDVFLSLFPHIRSFNDFGPLAHPRALEEDMNDDLFVA